MPAQTRTWNSHLSVEQAVALLLLLAFAAFLSPGCCAALVSRQKSAADLRASGRDLAATWDVIRGYVVPAPALAEDERTSLERALQGHGRACAEVAKHADALADAEGTE